ncbi:MAG: TRAP transporter substrate-binding protein DctP [Desulfatibacillaceae bacterium]
MRTSKTVLFAAVLLAACLCLSTAGSVEAKDYKWEWKMATLAPDGIGYAKQMKTHVFPVIEEETNGELKIKVYWGGIMGDDEDYVKKMRIGQLHGAGFSGQGSTIACPEMTVVELPFMFRNYDEVDYIKLKMRDKFDKILEKNGYRALAWTDQDFDQIYSSKYKLDSLNDFEKARFMTWYGPLEEELFKALGATPVPVNVPEATTSVRQGVVDAAIGPAIWVVGSQSYNIIKYVLPIKIRYSPGLCLVTMDAWNDLDEEYQKRFHEIRYDVEKAYVEAVRKDNEKALDALLRYGIREVKVPEDELAEIKTRSRKVWEELAGELYPKDVLHEMMANLEEYREKNGDQ